MYVQHIEPTMGRDEEPRVFIKETINAYIESQYGCRHNWLYAVSEDKGKWNWEETPQKDTHPGVWLEKKAAELSELMAELQRSLAENFDIKTETASIKPVPRVVTVEGLHMRYFDIMPKDREYAFVMKFKTVLLTEAGPGSVHSRQFFDEAESWASTKNCAVLLIWEADTRRTIDIARLAVSDGSKKAAGELDEEAITSLLLG